LINANKSGCNHIMRCATCNKIVDTDGKILFRDECPHCSADLHICKNCLFYDTGADNDCRESNAELVLDKERANFCEYFRPAEDQAASTDAADEVKRKLDALFKKSM
jgi:phage FluMu protein Com